jgi:two-component response regulator ARR-A family
LSFCAIVQNGFLKDSARDILQEQQPIDMVLTDYCMPEMTGYDLLKAIKVITHIKHFNFLCHLCGSICAFSMADASLFQGRFQALNPLKPIPVIVMSSDDEPQRISR